MRDVVIVGGGLSGMAAAVELEKHNIDYAIIEVKNRLGGSLNTITQDGFVVDTGAFFIAVEPDLYTILSEYELPDALLSTGEKTAIFKAGIKTLLDVMEAQIHAPRLRRMSVSSIGDIDGRLSLCMENGLMFDAKSIILAVPARYAERMFYSYIPEVAEQLLEFHYDSVVRVAICCHKDDLKDSVILPPDMAYVFNHQTDHPARVPHEHLLLQLGVRIDPTKCDDPAQVVPEVIEQIQLSGEPKLQRVDYWAEADLLSSFDDHHLTRLRTIKQQLPDNIALIGSDYSLVPPSYRGVFRLAERIRQGQTAARHMIERLKAK